MQLHFTIGGKYLSKKNAVIAKNIAERDYWEREIQYAQKEKQLLEQLATLKNSVNAWNYYDQLIEGRRQLVEPYLISDDAYAAKWLAQRSELHNDYEIGSQLVTENNEIVRSKTETLIADKLKQAGVPYKYEEALQLGRRVVYPDFTILDKRTRKVYIWEHFGMVDNPEYQDKMLDKIDLYAEHGYFMNDNLIITFEAANHPISTVALNRIVKRFAERKDI